MGRRTKSVETGFPPFPGKKLADDADFGLDFLMARHTRKQKNSGLVDTWLDNLGFYRKNIACDETCLFRAVSEQVYSLQIYHEKCRKEVIDYTKKNSEEFSALMATDELMKHLHNLEMHMSLCGEVEIEMISRTYKKNIIVFNGNYRKVDKVTNGCYTESLLLCLIEDHYDVVYQKSCIEIAGFCQSIVYTNLYENVFHIKNIPKIVDTMLHDKSVTWLSSKSAQESPNDKAKDNEEDGDILNNNNSFALEKYEFDDYEHMLKTKIPPFSFKVAKALDEEIYRNIEYDTWIELRKEFHVSSWYYGDNNFTVGTCCLVATNRGPLKCYIQDMKRKENTCVVYISSLAEKRVVKYSDLTPEPDAKPWPIPFRFMRHSSTPALPDIKKKPEEIRQNDTRVNNGNRTPRSLGQRRCNKRNQGERSVSTNEHTTTLTLPIRNGTRGQNGLVDEYRGPSLHMLQTPQLHTHEDLRNIENPHTEEFETTWISSNSNDLITLDTPPTVEQIQLLPEELIYEHPHTEPCNTIYMHPPVEHIPSTTHHHDYVLQSPPEVMINIQQPSHPATYYPEHLSHQSSLVPVLFHTPSPQVPQFYPQAYPNSAPVTPVVFTPGLESQNQNVFVYPTPPPQQHHNNYGTVYSPGVYSQGYNPPVDLSFISPTVGHQMVTNWYRTPPVDAQGFVFPTPVTPHK